MSQTFQNDAELAEYFHSFHTYIRNKFGLYGKAALQFFNFFFVLKVIEPFIGTEDGMINFNVGIPPDDKRFVDCKFSSLLNELNENMKISKVDSIKRAIFNSEHKQTFFMNFPLDKFDAKKQNLTEFLKNSID